MVGSSLVDMVVLKAGLVNSGGLGRDLTGRSVLGSGLGIDLADGDVLDSPGLVPLGAMFGGCWFVARV